MNDEQLQHENDSLRCTVQSLREDLQAAQIKLLDAKGHARAKIKNIKIKDASRDEAEALKHLAENRVRGLPVQKVQATLDALRKTVPELPEEAEKLMSLLVDRCDELEVSSEELHDLVFLLKRKIEEAYLQLGWEMSDHREALEAEEQRFLARRATERGTITVPQVSNPDQERSALKTLELILELFAQSCVARAYHVWRNNLSCSAAPTRLCVSMVRQLWETVAQQSLEQQGVAVSQGESWAIRHDILESSLKSEGEYLQTLEAQLAGALNMEAGSGSTNVKTRIANLVDCVAGLQRLVNDIQQSNPNHLNVAERQEDFLKLQRVNQLHQKELQERAFRIEELSKWVRDLSASKSTLEERVSRLERELAGVKPAGNLAQRIRRKAVDQQKVEPK